MGPPRGQINDDPCRPLPLTLSRSQHDSTAMCPRGFYCPYRNPIGDLGDSEVGPPRRGSADDRAGRDSWVSNATDSDQRGVAGVVAKAKMIEAE